jgi:hypothetical protein
MPIRDIGSSPKLFNLDEARELLDLVKRITDRHQQELIPIRYRLDRMLSNDPRRAEIETEFERVVERWKVKMEQLGVYATSLWVVEFDVGDGYLSWRYPELSISHFRSYDSSLSERQKLTDYVEEQDPDWAV